MKSNAKSKIIILITLGIVFILLSINSTNLILDTGNSYPCSEYSNDISFIKENLKTSQVSEPIFIDGNSGWVDFKNDGNCTGSGTYSDPYIIEDLVIDGRGSKNGENCIWIENSNVYFTIENCTLYNAISCYPPGEYKAGIKLSNVNNSLVIMNNCSMTYYGIYLSGCYHNIIARNTANYNYRFGIGIVVSNNNIISGNTANNNMLDGISCGGNSNFISGNNASNNGVSGIYVYGVNNFLSGNAISFNSVNGINLVASHRNKITENIISFDDANGIYLEGSNWNDITENKVFNNSQFGIYLKNSDDNIVSGNTLQGNDGCFIEIDCVGNTFSDNGDCIYGQDDGIIPGYNLFVLFGILSVVVFILSKKLKKS